MRDTYEQDMQQIKKYNDENRLERLFDISRGLEIPNKLYRYRKMNDYTIDEIVNQHVYLAEPNSDDIFDSKIVIKGERAEATQAAYLLTKEWQDRDPKMEESYKFYKGYFEEWNERVEKVVRITCFTETNTNVPMWKYYADSYKGICIEYSVDIDNVVDESAMTLFLPVIYTNDFTKYYVVDDQFKPCVETAIMNSVLKMEDWKFEKEWRIISLFADESKSPYVGLQISAIYFGVETDDSSKELIKSQIEKNGLKIDLYQMEQELTGLECHKLQ